jgi:dihydrofolate reductase
MQGRSQSLKLPLHSRHPKNKHGDIWPTVNTATKYVASNTITSHEWQPSVFLNGDIAEKITKIKQQEGPDLHVYGSGNLIQTLLKHNLVDAFWLKIFPITLTCAAKLGPLLVMQQK